MRTAALLIAALLVSHATAQPKPYYEHPITIPSTLQMYWFDRGGEGVAYHDCTERGDTADIRKEDNVDIGIEGGARYLGWLCEGEWVNYSLHAARASTYRIDARVASANDGGRFRLTFSNADGKSVGQAELTVPATGGWTQWHTVTGNVTLPSGPLSMRFEHLSGQATYNVNQIRFCRFDPLDLDRNGRIDAADEQALKQCLDAAGSLPDKIAALKLPADDAADLLAVVNKWRPLDGSKLAPSAPWELTWSDEFHQPGLPDPAKWQYELGYKIRNDESQHYTKDKNAFIENGNLVIEARREASKTDDGREASYTAASISPTTSWTYGRIEVRAKVPTGRGMWPAIWMLADRIHSVGWPQCGEIDIMENVGYDPQVVHGTVHNKKYNHVLGTQQSSSLSLPQPWKDFHVYAIEWHPDRIDFFIDRIHYLTYRNEGSGEAAWPFDHPHRLKLNIAVGGMWGAVQGINDDIFPQRMEIDYVRAYRAK